MYLAVVCRCSFKRGETLSGLVKYSFIMVDILAVRCTPRQQEHPNLTRGDQSSSLVSISQGFSLCCYIYPLLTCLVHSLVISAKGQVVKYAIGSTPKDQQGCIWTSLDVTNACGNVMLFSPALVPGNSHAAITIPS